MNKTLILKKIKEYYKFNTNAQFARFLEITPQNLNQWYTRNTYDIHILATKCKEISIEWITTGEGELLKKSEEEQKNIIPDNKNFTDAGDYITISRELFELIKADRDTVKILQDTIKMQQQTIHLQQQTIAQLNTKLQRGDANEDVKVATAQ